MEGEDVFDGVDGRVGGEEVEHGGIVDGTGGYGLAGEVCEGEVVVEGRQCQVEKEGDRVERDSAGLKKRDRGKRDSVEKKNKK